MRVRSGSAAWAGVFLFCCSACTGALSAEKPEFTTEAAVVTRIFELADERLATMPAVAAIKWQTHVPIYDRQREEAVVQRAQELGAPMGLAGEPIRALFELQVRIARDVQASLHEGWKVQGFRYSEPVTPLGELRPRLDGLTVELLRTIYLAGRALQRSDFAQRYAELARERLRSMGWTDGNRREFLEALQGVRRAPVAALQRIESSRILRIGTTGDYAPFSLESDGSLTGSDIELAQELAARLRARAVFVRTTWSAMLDELEQGDFDLSMGGVSITPAREARAAFSLPYASGGKTIIARCADSRRFRELAGIDRARVRVIVNPGGSNEQYVRSNLHRAQILVYPDNRGIFDELSAGRADVMITDDVEVELQTRRHPDLCRTFPGTLTHADKAVLMPRESDLIGAVNDWLGAAIASGEPSRVLKSYLDR